MRFGRKSRRVAFVSACWGSLNLDALWDSALFCLVSDLWRPPHSDLQRLGSEKAALQEEHNELRIAYRGLRNETLSRAKLLSKLETVLNDG